jgi:hypothetical protein
MFLEAERAPAGVSADRDWTRNSDPTAASRTPRTLSTTRPGIAAIVIDRL